MATSAIGLSEAKEIAWRHAAQLQSVMISAQ